MDKDARNLIVSACRECDFASMWATTGERHCEYPKGPREALPTHGIHYGCPLERREPWLKLREAAEAILESPIEHDGPHISYKLMQVEGYKLDDLRSAIEAVKEK